MPELPEVTMYVEGASPPGRGRDDRGGAPPLPLALLKSWDPPLSSVVGLGVRTVSRLGKRLVFGLDDDLFLVLHLMVTGRLRWRAPGVKIPGKGAHGALDFPSGSLLITGGRDEEAGHPPPGPGRGRAGGPPPGGGGAWSRWRWGRRPSGMPSCGGNRTLKRALTDPSIFSGIGGAHADEILWEAGLSPVQRTGNLDLGQVARLREATRSHLEAVHRPPAGGDGRGLSRKR